MVSYAPMKLRGEEKVTDKKSTGRRRGGANTPVETTPNVSLSSQSRSSLLSLNEKPDVFTLDEVAAFARITRKTLYNLIIKGQGPLGRRLGNQWRFLKEDVKNWIAGRR